MNPIWQYLGLLDFGAMRPVFETLRQVDGNIGLPEFVGPRQLTFAINAGGDHAESDSQTLAVLCVDHASVLR